MIFQSDSVVEGLGDRLDREFLSGVACLVNRTVGGYQADAKPIRVRITEFRDIGRQFAFAIVAQAAVEELGLDRLFFIPAGQSPFKLESPPSPAAVRPQLLRLALAGRTHYDTASSLIVAEGAGGSLNTTPTKFVGANAIAAVIARTGIHVVSCMDEIFRLDAIAHQWTRSARSSTPSLRSAFEIQTPLQAVRALPDSPAPRPLLRADQRQGRRVRIAPFRPTSPADAPVSIDHRAMLASGDYASLG